MLARDYITHWRAQAPWQTDRQIEQDLLLSRLIVEIARDELLGPELAFRGGTCIHKLHLPQPLRYSEDLDYVRTTRGGIKPIIDRLELVADRLGLRRVEYESSRAMVRLFVATPATDNRPIRIKIEINIGETESCFARITRPYAVHSPWFAGEADVQTFALEEILATKLRALYQRRKGRDLFDLWCVLTQTPGLDDAAIVAAHRYYMGKQLVSGEVIHTNVQRKLGRRDYLSDLEALVNEVPQAFEMAAAVELVRLRLLVRLS